MARGVPSVSIDPGGHGRASPCKIVIRTRPQQCAREHHRVLCGSVRGRLGQLTSGWRRSGRSFARYQQNVARRAERPRPQRTAMLEQALEWIAQHRAAMVALVVVLALTLLAGRRW